MNGDSGPRMALFNLAEPAVRAGFVAACVGAVKAGAADGCFIDRAISCLPTQPCAVGECGCLDCPDLTQAQVSAYNIGHAQLLTDLQAGVGPHNPIIANHAVTLNVTNSAQLENFFQGKSGGVDGIKTLLKCAHNSKLCEAHITIGSSCTNITQPLAAFLVGAGPLAFVGCGAWHVHDTSGHLPPETWHPCYDRPLGDPVGPPTVSGPPGCNAEWVGNASTGKMTLSDNCSFRSCASLRAGRWPHGTGVPTQGQSPGPIRMPTPRTAVTLHDVTGWWWVYAWAKSFEVWQFHHKHPRCSLPE